MRSALALAVVLAPLLALAACDAPKEATSPGGGTPQAKVEQEAQAGPMMRPDRLIRDFAGSPAPDVALETGPDGATETIADILAANPGKPLLVNLWATWCAPCLKELPTLDRLAGETKGQLVIVPVSQDMEGWRAVTPAFTAEKYPNLVTRVESGMQFGAALKATGLPVTILYGPDGKEVWRYNGDLDWAGAEARALIEGSLS
jgi:thiol-disulfide isomerase/thioredoxin